MSDAGAIRKTPQEVLIIPPVFGITLFTRCESSSVVELHLAKVDVASSNLVFRSLEPLPSGSFFYCTAFGFRSARYGNVSSLHTFSILPNILLQRDLLVANHPDFHNTLHEHMDLCRR